MAAVLRPLRQLNHLRWPEFTHMNSYWDPVQNVEVVRILAGEYYATHCHEMITTVLGSCISVCIRDRTANIGGMNHFMLPVEREGRENSGAHGLSADAAYGSYAMAVSYTHLDVYKRQGEEYSDEQIHELIFHPGLSTAKQISDVSGRGVGMDVVRRNCLLYTSRCV